MTTYNAMFDDLVYTESIVTRAIDSTRAELSYNSTYRARAWAVKGIAVSILSTLAIFGAFVLMIVR